MYGILRDSKRKLNWAVITNNQFRTFYLRVLCKKVDWEVRGILLKHNFTDWGVKVSFSAWKKKKNTVFFKKRSVFNIHLLSSFKIRKTYFICQLQCTIPLFINNMYVTLQSSTWAICSHPPGVLYSRLQRVTIPDAVIIQFVLLKMGMLMLVTCRGL